VFNTITISDGISMGRRDEIFPGIAGSDRGFDWKLSWDVKALTGVVAIGGCDKNMPGCIMGMARLNRPSVVCIRWDHTARAPQ